MKYTTDFSRQVVAFAGLPFDVVGLDSAYNYINAAMENKEHCFLTTPNLNFVISAVGDKDFLNSVLMSDLVVADGMPIVWLSKLLKLPIAERVAGSSLFEKFMETPTLRKKKIFFFGGPDGAGELAQRRLKASQVECCGFISPGFKSVDELSDSSYIEKINASETDFLVVALGAKKGQAWIVKNRHLLTVPAVSHLGAVINFVAGSVSRAPHLVQKMGLEWLWRIKEEPSLWKRYYLDGKAAVGLFFNKIIPLYRLLQVNSKFSSLEKSEFNFGVRTDEHQLVVHFDGNCVESTLNTLRNFFIHDVLEPKDLVIDLQNLTYIDAFGMGFLMLLKGHQLKNNLNFSIVNTSADIRKIFGLYCAEYLVE